MTKDAGYLNPLVMENKNFYRRNLPHINKEYSYYFVTFRLFGSLQKEIIIELKKYYYTNKKIILNLNTSESLKSKKLYDLQKKYFGLFDGYLDTNKECINYLCEPRISKIVSDSIKYRDGREYRLNCFCIMPNHVHMVVYVKRFDKPFYRIMQSLKRHSARQSNIILNREGSFWHEESYDHIIRNPQEYFNIINYILYNPVKAGLVKNESDWKWSYCNFKL